MGRTLCILLLVAGALVPGCGCRLGPPPPPPREPPPAAPNPAPPREEEAETRPRPLNQRVSFAFQDAPLAEVLSTLALEAKVDVAVSPRIPVETWRDRRVTLRMEAVTMRAFLDWLVRLLGGQYAVEADGSVWICRGDELLKREPIVVRSLRVSTHLRIRRPRRGVLNFGREKEAVLETLEACLGYLLQRRPECKLAFRGRTDMLVASLPARGHVRLRSLLRVMRGGRIEPGSAGPSRNELRARLDRQVESQGGTVEANGALWALARRARVNLGWDAERLGTATVDLPPGTFTLARTLAAIAEQTPLARGRLEPGHGIWLFLEKEKRQAPVSGAVPWDRAFVQGYDVSELLKTREPDAIIRSLQTQVDPGQWQSGLPAASVSLPSRRLIVVHDEHGHRRVRAALDDLAAGRIKGVEMPREPVER